jgi:hypothetical protein
MHRTRRIASRDSSQTKSLLRPRLASPANPLPPSPFARSLPGEALDPDGIAPPHPPQGHNPRRQWVSESNLSPFPFPCGAVFGCLLLTSDVPISCDLGLGRRPWWTSILRFGSFCDEITGFPFSPLFPLFVLFGLCFLSCDLIQICEQEVQQSIQGYDWRGFPHQGGAVRG